MRASADVGACNATELQRVHRALRTLSASNRALLRAEVESALFAEFCRIAVEEGGYRLAWVSRAEHDADKTARPIASAGFDEGYLESIRISWADTPLGHGPTGTAIRTGRFSVIQNLLTDPREAPWREATLAHGYGSLLALPLRVEGAIFGAISIAAPEPDAFGDDEVALLSETAEDLAFGLETLRMRARGREAEETIRRMAYFDALTGLPNRLQLQERLGAALDEAKTANRPLSVLYLQVGSFREITEALGYRESDSLLQEIATRLVEAVGGRELVARVGDDAFVTLLGRGDAEAARRLAQHLIEALAQPVELAGLMLDARPSIGITFYPGHGDDPEALLRRAAVANFHARERGSGQAFYAGGLDGECTRRLALMGELRRAIEGEELRLFCQPKVEIGSGRICGAEALVRWAHPQHGMLDPGAFIKLAESAGLITPLTYWVLGAALRQSYAWHAAGLTLPLAVNLSPHDLRDPQLLERIGGALATWGAQPDWIQFEITESALMDDPARARSTLGRLKDLGVELFIDDFGTGYSSLAYLQKLPVDSIKIDQSFVIGMVTDEDSAVIVRSTIEMAHNLGLRVVAEGVETPAIATRLAALGCEAAQGYCISRPMPAADYAAWQAGFRWAH
jgi:diguanylate cyclase (GGDEF)-like protein